ncbi:hypothetical protein [Photorhabdus tasmaniensis]|uniref:Uncharacterized protein n=1 Tax=Photorhabdus tasmaniensis TaxID=1004159 RepID=A0ABX0GMC2_9GAMM|nr:hypothetical protein [Photorhabdus tasmaniensis]NHB90393.1 hypothetical protein [Photorhabdus tasmaniensis]
MQTLKSRLETVAHCFGNDFGGFKLKNSKADAMKWLMRFNLPYLVREHAPGKYLLLNREYKPLGFMAKTGGYDARYVNYDDHTLSGTEGLLNAQKDHFFYNDSLAPWDSATNWKAYQEGVLEFLKRFQS